MTSMSLETKLEIRSDDVLQSADFTYTQKKVAREKTMFEWFKEADKVFERYNYPCILAVLSEGIDREPEWVEYIKERQDRYVIDLHGSNHKYHRYAGMSEQDLYDDLALAKEKIESTFNVEVKNWYVPFGRKARNPYGEKVCEKLGIKQWIPSGKVDAKLWFKWKNIPHVNFHYWYEPQVKDVENILNQLCQE